MEVLAVCDGEGKALSAHAVNRKGGGGESVARAVAEGLDPLGYRRGLLRGDQEPALEELRSNVDIGLAGEAALEHSPIGSSRSNGAGERAIRSVEEEVRVVKDAAEKRTGCVLAAGHPTTPWLTQHCAEPLMRHVVGDDKKTAYTSRNARRKRR